MQGDLIDLQLGIQFAALLQDLAGLVGGDGVHAAPEADQLHQVHIRLGGAVFGRGVQPAVVGPLVQDAGGEFFHPVRDAVLGDDRRAVPDDQPVDAVVDLGVHMIGPPRQHDDPLALAAGLGDDLAAPGADLGHVAGVFGVGRVRRLLDLPLGDAAEVPGQDLFGHLAHKVLGAVDADVVTDKLLALQLRAVAQQHLGVIGDHRAVVVVVPQALVDVVGQAGVKSLGRWMPM